jgi:hypothetical protein
MVVGPSRALALEREFVEFSRDNGKTVIGGYPAIQP